MKRFLSVFILIGFVAFGAFAQAGGPLMAKGDSAASIGFNLWGYGVGGGYEYMFERWDLADTIPLTFGAAGKVGVGFQPQAELTVVGLATVHFSLAPFDLPSWVQKFDWYYGLGLGMGVLDGFGIGVATGGGVSYHITPKIAILADVISAIHFNKAAGGISTIGLQFKL